MDKTETEFEKQIARLREHVKSKTVMGVVLMSGEQHRIALNRLRCVTKEFLASCFDSGGGAFEPTDGVMDLLLEAVGSLEESGEGQEERDG